MPLGGELGNGPDIGRLLVDRACLLLISGTSHRPEGIVLGDDR